MVYSHCQSYLYKVRGPSGINILLGSPTFICNKKYIKRGNSDEQGRTVIQFYGKFDREELRLLVNRAANAENKNKF